MVFLYTLPYNLLYRTHNNLYNVVSNFRYNTRIYQCESYQYIYMSHIYRHIFLKFHLIDYKSRVCDYFLVSIPVHFDRYRRFSGLIFHF